MDFYSKLISIRSLTVSNVPYYGKQLIKGELEHITLFFFSLNLRPKMLVKI